MSRSSSDITYDSGTATGSAEFVLGGLADGVLLLAAGDQVLVVDAAADGVTVEALTATDFSRPLARVTLSSAPAAPLDLSYQRFVDLAATVLAAEAAGLARWMLETASEYAKVREQFGKPIGSFQAVKHMCAEMLLRSQQISVAAADAAAAVGDPDESQLSIAVAVAAAIGIEAAKVNARDCIQVLGGIGITWEHDAHLYMRRAYAIAQFLGGKSRWLRRSAELTRAGVRRQLHVDVTGAEDIRPAIAATVADIAAAAQGQVAGGVGRDGPDGATLARALRARRVACRAAGDRPGTGGGGCAATGHLDRLVGGADHPRARHARADRALHSRHAERRRVLVPAVQ